MHYSLLRRQPIPTSRAPLPTTTTAARRGLGCRAGSMVAVHYYLPPARQARDVHPPLLSRRAGPAARGGGAHGVNVKCIVARPWGGETPPEAVATLLDEFRDDGLMMERRLKPIQPSRTDEWRVSVELRVPRGRRGYAVKELVAAGVAVAAAESPCCPPAAGSSLPAGRSQFRRLLAGRSLAVLMAAVPASAQALPPAR